MSWYDQFLTANFRLAELLPRTPMRCEDLPLEALFQLPDPASIRPAPVRLRMPVSRSSLNPLRFICFQGLPRQRARAMPLLTSCGYVGYYYNSH